MKKLQMWYISRRKRTILQFIRRRSFVRSFNFHLPLPPRQIRILIIRCIATLAITHTKFRGHTAPLHAARITLCASCVPFCIARNFVLGFSLCEHRKQEQKPEDEVLHNAFADRLIVANREYSRLEISARKRLIYRSFFLVSRYESRIFKKPMNESFGYVFYGATDCKKCRLIVSTLIESTRGENPGESKNDRELGWWSVDKIGDDRKHCN